MPNALRVIFLDNIDSFTYNLVDEFAKRGAEVETVRNDVPAERVLSAATRGGPALLVVSPGPGAPSEAGCALEVLRRAPARVPTFGVCLGHQALIEACGGAVDRAPRPLHGKATNVSHGGDQLFHEIPNPFPVGRYHSLAAARLPDVLEPIAYSGDVVMAVRHRSAPAIGVQFHPESVLTPHGGILIDNVIRWALDAGR